MQFGHECRRRNTFGHGMGIYDTDRGEHTMKTTKLIAALGAAAMLAQPALADNEFDDRWYIGAASGVAISDTSRETDNSYHGGFNIGTFITPRWSLDFRLDRYSFTFDEPTPGDGEKFRMTSLGALGRFHMGSPEDRTRPYLLIGTGLQDHASFYDTGRDIFGSAGFGLMHRFTDHVFLRAEVEARYDNDRDTFNRSSGFLDVLGTIGLNVRLGDLPPPPPPPAEPPPPPPPPPAAPEPEPEPEPEVLFEFDSAVFFNFDSAVLRPESRAELNEAAAMLNLHDEIVSVEVAGHTCDIGSAEYNQGLSERRAQAVRDFLVEEGEVDPDRLVVRGYGEDRPKVPNTSRENREQNRRVELVVLERSN